MGVAISSVGVASVCTFYRLETTFEPIFAELALYDAKERKKVILFISMHWL